MRKLLFLLTVGLFASTIALAQDGGDGKTYYDAAKTKPKEVYSYKEVYKFDPSNPSQSTTSKMKHGPYFYYYENGKLKISGQYRDDQKHGEWKYYDEKGTLTSVENYVSGQLKEE